MTDKTETKQTAELKKYKTFLDNDGVEYIRLEDAKEIALEVGKEVGHDIHKHCIEKLEKKYSGASKSADWLDGIKDSINELKTML